MWQPLGGIAADWKSVALATWIQDQRLENTPKYKYPIRPIWQPNSNTRNVPMATASVTRVFDVQKADRATPGVFLDLQV